jgi:hypothetical protein
LGTVRDRLERGLKRSSEGHVRVNRQPDMAGVLDIGSALGALGGGTST